MTCPQIQMLKHANCSSVIRGIVSLLFGAIFVQLYYSALLPVGSQVDQRTVIQSPDQEQVPSTDIFSRKKLQSLKVIMFWTKYFGVEDFGFGMGVVPFIKAKCRTNRRFSCMTTSDRSFFNHSDAIIFHSLDLNLNDLPPPSWRLPHQHYIFLLHESPILTNLDTLRANQFKYYFNRTMTYRRDSDIIDLYPYGRIKCNSDTSSSSACRDFPRANNDPGINIPESRTVNVKIDISQKNRTVAWFVSHCEAESKRELLVRKLSLHIPVDIYGCSKLSCPRDKQPSCDLMLRRHYRFYLSFENSLCPDYISEKLYRPLSYDTVPVVFGGSDYSLYLPAGSYIDARDFASPFDLANHLNKLMVDDKLYLSYFRWRGQYVVDPAPTDGWCNLCRLITSDAGVKIKTYPDIEAWWAGKLTNHSCLSPPPFLVS